MMSFNNINTSSRTYPLNGTQNGTSYKLLVQPANTISFPIKMHAKGIFTGTLKNVSHVQIFPDRIILMNLRNNQNESKFNITIPYVEILALRYCFTGDISIFVIQPILESYHKLSGWMKTTTVRAIPENFIMIHFDKMMKADYVETIRRECQKCNSAMRFIEINPVFAHSYLSTPNKIHTTTKKTATPKSPSSDKSFSHEVIHLEDSDEEEDAQKKKMLHQCILRYPNNEPNPIILYGNDLNCLRDGHYLNDNIMNFYLKYYQHHKNENDDYRINDENIKSPPKCISTVLMNKIHIYDALFATHLLNNNRKQPFSETYQKVLKKWTKDIDIFSKDFLFIPLIKDSHWFLVILCYIGNLIPEHSNGHSKPHNHDSKDIPHKPTIIFMDSLNQYVPRNEISKTISKYLSCELKEKRNMSGEIEPIVLDELYPKVPQQQNYYDCGLFVLEYIEKFLAEPEHNFNLIRNDSRALARWFEPSSLETKRAKIRQIILNFLNPEDARKLEAELVEINLVEANNGNNEFLNI